MKNKTKDIVLSLIIGHVLAALALAYFDVLIKN